MAVHVSETWWFIGYTFKMTTYVKNEVIWLPSQEEVLVKQEEDDSLETCSNTPEHLYSEQSECKRETRHEIYIKEEPQELIENEDSSSFDLEHTNHQILQFDDTSSRSEDHEKVNYVNLDNQAGLILKCPYCQAKDIRKKKYKECYDTQHTDSQDELCKESCSSPIEGEEEQTDEECFLCLSCNKAFNTKQLNSNNKNTEKSDLTCQESTHTEKKPFSCDVCHKKFAIKCNLIAHSRIHTGEMPYSCDVCNKKFAIKCNLITHSRIHTGEKPFTCDVCNKKFTTKSHLTLHRRTHTGEKPFSCDVCNKQFTRKAHLTSHQVIHTCEMPFSCDLCGMQFTKKVKLTVHKRIHRKILM